MGENILSKNMEVRKIFWKEIWGFDFFCHFLKICSDRVLEFVKKDQPLNILIILVLLMQIRSYSDTSNISLGKHLWGILEESDQVTLFDVT